MSSPAEQPDVAGASPPVQFRKRGRMSRPGDCGARRRSADGTGAAAAAGPADPLPSGCAENADADAALLQTAAARRREQRQADARRQGPTVHRTERAQLAALDKLSEGFMSEMEMRRKEHTAATAENQLHEKGKAGGPKPATSANVRVAGSFDLSKPHICKPYYRTGYCPYGDACKYAHLREDYMNMQQLDRKWEADQARRRVGDGGESDDSGGQQGEGLNCPLCSAEFAEPVQTRCGHCFCAACAERWHQQSPKGLCAVCGTPTLGVFNRAGRIVRRLELREAERKRQARNARVSAACGSEDEAEPEPGDGAERPKRPRRDHHFSASQWLVPPAATTAAQAAAGALR
eukprot:TRINITY_DN25146_c0_g1_i1.p1 TRINITY_DN25146_c0_g1~~TRINITY_DN25146_c0_g1_i1.p1  ORF type:complete len:370 (+),score=84.83 TRINITY_DN25146_c0_g1_i1:68-1111(+)